MAEKVNKQQFDFGGGWTPVHEGILTLLSDIKLKAPSHKHRSYCGLINVKLLQNWCSTNVLGHTSSPPVKIR
jgi:hypothetical protein